MGTSSANFLDKLVIHSTSHPKSQRTAGNEAGFIPFIVASIVFLHFLINDKRNKNTY